MQEKLNIGNEVKVFTKDGKSYEGILMDCHKGYLSTLAGLGIILTFPLNSILNIIKI
tara:strand:+ start:1888 stop:2058 length:171 start_codon:yes stop_codon:yes gene_type:complete